MNDLYLIGNGFDRAHGLETSYNDFLLWYLNDFLNQLWTKKELDDKLMKIESMGTRYQVPCDFKSVLKLLTWLDENKYKISTNNFFEKIIRDYSDCRWVDIEYEYFFALIKLYEAFEEDRLNDGDFLRGLKPLNDCFDSIKQKLAEYLKEIEITPKHENRQIESVLLEGTGAEGKEQGEKLFVNFNYTKTLELYTNRNFPLKNNLVNIHGELVNPSNPIIFGYGDEMDPHYEKIENLNNNEFLKNIKSFGYFRTDNYQRVMRFIEGLGNHFTVKILGHSCGLSDRILLNTIFEHPNCKAIKIFYYQKSVTENDYFEKTQEISRHFKATGKGDMRTKIVPFDQSIPMPQVKKSN